MAATIPQRPAWDDGRWQSLPALQRPLRADVCVIGLGGSGLTAIRALRAAGLTVVGVDAGSVAGGAAGRNGGFLLAGLARFYHDTVAAMGRERARALYAETLTELVRMLADAPEYIERTGSLRIAASDDELLDCQRQYDALRADDFAVEHYSGIEGEGLLFPADARCNPLQRCRALAVKALGEGARLFEHSKVVSIIDGRVDTEAGRVSSAHVIVAVDGRLEELLPELSGRVRTARLQMLGTAPTQEVTLPRPVYARWGYDYWQQLADGRVVLGGCRDAFEDAEWTHDASPSQAVQQQLENILRERLRVTAPVTHRWAASVGYTPDDQPLLDEVRPRVWAIGGYSGTGNIVGALCARAVVQRIIGQRSAFADLLQPS